MTGLMQLKTKFMYQYQVLFIILVDSSNSLTLQRRNFYWRFTERVFVCGAGAGKRCIERKTFLELFSLGVSPFSVFSFVLSVVS
uniref:Uncharacterized protein n=1 Tax=Octopus bimaculoides TaxID=37653 RepID=A0A0L8FI53_OCTBM